MGSGALCSRAFPKARIIFGTPDRRGGTPLFGWRTRYWSFLLKLAKRLPSWTVQAQPGAAIGPFHWNNRRLTFEEMCRLQTFPDGLHLDCGRTEMQRMLGNAVPSLIAEIMAREIRHQLLDTKKRGQLRLMPPRREVIPRPARGRHRSRRSITSISVFMKRTREPGRVGVRRTKLIGSRRI